MNQRDRERMARLYGCMSKLPWPNRARTVGVGELSQFFSDMERLQPQFMTCIMAISRADDPIQEPDAELDELERMVL